MRTPVAVASCAACGGGGRDGGDRRDDDTADNAMLSFRFSAILRRSSCSSSLASNAGLSAGIGKGCGWMFCTWRCWRCCAHYVTRGKCFIRWWAACCVAQGLGFDSIGRCPRSGLS